MLRIRNFVSALLLVVAIQNVHGSDYNCNSDCNPCQINNYCDPCNTCCDPCGGLSFYVDYLLWVPRNCQLHYAATDDGAANADNGRVYGVCPNYHSGFRLGLTKTCDDMDYGFRYTYFSGDWTDHVVNSDGELASTRLASSNRATSDGDIQFASGSYDIDLNQFDFEAGYAYDYDCNTDMRFFGGFKIAVIEQRLDCRYYETLSDVDSNANPVDDADYLINRADLHAYGFYLGSRLQRSFCDCYNFYGEMSLGTLVGSTAREWHTLGTTGGAPIGDSDNYKLQDKCTRLVGNLNLALGVAYDFCNCWELAFGYEYHLWWNVSNSFLVSNNGDLQVSTSPDTLGFDGFVFRLGADF